MQFRVNANQVNSTGVRVLKGQVVEIKCDSKQQWIDFTVTCGPAGYTSQNIIARLGECLRDAPKSNWFCLCASIAGKVYPIGLGTTFVAEESGDLMLFANDINALRWNNSGSVLATIQVK